MKKISVAWTHLQTESSNVYDPKYSEWKVFSVSDHIAIFPNKTPAIQGLSKPCKISSPLSFILYYYVGNLLSEYRRRLKVYLSHLLSGEKC